VWLKKYSKRARESGKKEREKAKEVGVGKAKL